MSSALRPYELYEVTAPSPRSETYVSLRLMLVDRQGRDYRLIVAEDGLAAGAKIELIWNEETVRALEQLAAWYRGL